jgi:predicted dehydrogenase
MLLRRSCPYRHEPMHRTGIAIVGTGYVADMYAATLPRHPELVLVGAYDKDPARLSAFCGRWPVRAHANLDTMLAEPSIEMVLNLTDPRSHFAVSCQCLERGKHVYSEKPLGMTSEQAHKLVGLAEQRGLYLASAPCSVLSETAQTVWKAISDGAVGTVRLVYANFDDGMIAPNLAPWTWVNECGVPWPAKDEFEVGCTFIHAGYVLTWLAAFFGPARAVSAFSSCQIPDKGVAVDGMAPDFSVGCLEYDGGIVARVTCGLVAPRDKSLTIVGDDGIIYVDTVRNDNAPVYVRNIPERGRTHGIERRMNRYRRWWRSRLPLRLSGTDERHFMRKYPFARKPANVIVDSEKPVDFNRGPSELAEAIQQRRPCRLSSRLGLHIVELIEALQFPERYNGKRTITSRFDPIRPLAWAK